jgi:hypothetical protein
MTENYEKLEQNLSLTLKPKSLNETGKDQIWKTIEVKTARFHNNRKRFFKFAIGLLVVLALVVIAIGPRKVLAQVRSWLIPNYRPIGQSENLVLVPIEQSENLASVPDESESIYRQLSYHLLSVVSTEKELYINVEVSGFDPSELTLDGERFPESPYLILSDGQVIRSNGGGYGFGDSSTEFLLEITFPPLENEPGDEFDLVIPDLPFKSNPLDEAWVISLMAELIPEEDRLPPIDASNKSNFDPGGLKAEIVAIKTLPARGTTIKVKVNIPETFQLLNFLTFWSLQDDQGNGYPIEDIYHCGNDPQNKDCPTDEVEFTIHPALPEGRTYTLQIPRINLVNIDDDPNFYEVNGEAKRNTFLTIELPETYSSGDFIEVDRWYSIEPYSFHLLGLEILQAEDDQVRFHLVMQSPDPIIAISLCINRFVSGAGCQGPSRDGMTPPDPDDLIYNTVSFPDFLTGPVEFYLHNVYVEHWVDLDVEFDL